MRLSLWAWLALATVAIAGCQGSGDGKGRQAVSGKVSIDGKPLDEGLITFVPDQFEGAPAGGPIKNGAYSIPRSEGPVAGAHTVSIYSQQPTGKKFPDPIDATVMIDEQFEAIPARYNAPTELKADVKASGGNSFDFDLVGRLTSPPPGSKR